MRTGVSAIVAATILVVAGVVADAPWSVAAARYHSPAALQNASLVLDWYVNSDHGGLFTALQRGMFRRRGID
ncbi:MAG TPA: hypothetical protein VKX16_13750, partial [Chloroflexota bacterium]|nr:hypothetical protein [Chloroflexota bacterium]